MQAASRAFEAVFILVLACCLSYSFSQTTTLYVSVSGSATGDGTVNSPFDIQTASQAANQIAQQPGSTANITLIFYPGKSNHQPNSNQPLSNRELFPSKLHFDGSVSLTVIFRVQHGRFGPDKPSDVGDSWWIVCFLEKSRWFLFLHQSSIYQLRNRYDALSIGDI